MSRKMIYADYMKLDFEGRLVLICRGTFNDLTKYNITFEEGKKYVFYNDDEDDDGNRDDLVVEGTAEYDSENERWTARIDFEEIKNVSQLLPEERKRLQIDQSET